MVLGVVGILFLAHLITRPVLALRDAANHLGEAEGDAIIVVPESGSDELADLARTFNRMAAQIRERINNCQSMSAYVERVLDQMESSIIVVSAAYRVEYVNRTAQDRHGSVTGASCRDIMSDERPCDECPVAEVLQTRAVIHRNHAAKSGRSYELRWVPIIGRDGNLTVVERALDITDRLELQHRFQRAQRLAVAGEIAAGVVHSVNNPLDGVRRALDLAAIRPGDQERVGRMLELAREGTDRIAEITRTLLGFARGDEAADPVSVQVDVLIDAAVSLSRLGAQAKDIDIHVDMASDLPEVLVDPQGMVEVLVNLMLNAVDASDTRGRVSIRARESDGGLCICVEDSGPGLAAGLAEKVFEPFYTTKDAANGTGLGLSVARRVVEAHGGELTYQSGTSGGACFVMSIPLTSDAVPQEDALG